MEPRFRVTDENRMPMDTALDARIVIPAHLQQKYGLAPAERTNVMITAYLTPHLSKRSKLLVLFD